MQKCNMQRTPTVGSRVWPSNHPHVMSSWFFFWVSAEIWQLWIYMKGRCWCISRTVYWQLSFIACNDFHQSLKPISSLKNDLNLWKRWEPQATSNNFFLGTSSECIEIESTVSNRHGHTRITAVLARRFWMDVVFFVDCGRLLGSFQPSLNSMEIRWICEVGPCHTHWYLLYGHGAHDGSIDCFAHLGSTSTWNGPGTMRDLWRFLALEVLEITQNLHIGGIEWNLFKLDAFASG